MSQIQLIGLSAALFTTISNVPQAYYIIKKKSSEGVSGVSYIVLIIGLMLWVFYGFVRHDLPIIIANGISAIISIVVLSLNYTSKKTLASIQEKIGLEEEKEKQESGEKDTD